MRLPVEQTGTVGKIYDTLNDIFDLLKAEPRVCSHRHCRRQRRKDDRCHTSGRTGAVRTCMQGLNTLITDLVQPMTEMARVITTVANGDLSQK